MKKIISLLMLLAMTPTLAMALPSFDRMKSKLNQNVVPSDGNLFRLGDQLTNKKVQVLKLTYDVSKDGGSIASHALKDVDGSYAKLPDNALIKEAYLDVLNQVTSVAAAPRLCFQAQGPCDLKGGITTTWYYPSGLSQILPKDGTTFFKLTADKIVYATVSGGALTGGTMNLFIEYFLSD
jgi:hypothetical protein